MQNTAHYSGSACERPPIPVLPIVEMHRCSDSAVTSDVTAAPSVQDSLVFWPPPSPPLTVPRQPVHLRATPSKGCGLISQCIPTPEAHEAGSDGG
jgi:hypothetical protein